MTKQFLELILSVLFVLLVSFSTIAQGAGDELFGLDIGVYGGIEAGTLVDPNRKAPVTIGGIPMGARITNDLNGTWSMLYQAGILLDLVNSQVVQQGGEVGLSWHFMGGSRHVGFGSTLGTIEGTSKNDLSLALRSGYYQMLASSKADPLDRVTGSLVEFKTGLEYRQEFFWGTAIGAEVLLSVITMPASVERLSYQGLSIIFVWRSRI